MHNNLFHTLALKKAPLLGDIMAKRLIRTFGSAEAVFKQNERDIAAVEGIGDKKAQFLTDKDALFKQAEQELEFIQDNQIDVKLHLDEDYSARLSHCVDSPIVYFQKGNVEIENPYTISIVGTRQITSYGASFLEKFIAGIAPFNPLIISGYAYGTDILAHKLAIEHNLQTVAVLAHGLNQTYPRNHQVYNEQMMSNGGFITDFWHSDTFDRKNFLGRNRIIAGLSEATIVIESANKGGSLVTADLACGYNREVFAVPGRVKDKYSVGCNELIKQHKAHVLTKPEDIAYILGWKKQDFQVQKQLFVELNENEKKIYRLLKTKKKELLDIIALDVDLPVHQVASILMGMELKGVIKPLPGKQFSLN